jgi:hypothetical protein
MASFTRDITEIPDIADVLNATVRCIRGGQSYYGYECSKI